MNIDIRNYSENNNKKGDNTPLSNEEYLKFEENKYRSKEIKKQSDIEQQLGMIALYNEEKQEEGYKQYCSEEYITHEVQKGDTLSTITLEYYESIEAWERIYEILGISHHIEVNQTIILPASLGKEYQLKQEYLQQAIKKLSLSENNLTPEQQETLKLLQEKLQNIEKYLQKFVELNWKVTSYKNETSGGEQSIKEHRKEVLKQFISNPNNKKYLEEFSQLHDKVTIYLGIEKQQSTRTNTDIENYLAQQLDSFLDYDEEMIEILILKKDEILGKMIQINPELQEQYGKNNKKYQEILEKKQKYQNKTDSVSKAWLYFYEGLEKDYLESIYTDNTKVLGIDWSTLQNLEMSINNLKENFSLGELFNIILSFPNKLRGYGWRGTRLFGDICKSVINENIYDIGVDKGVHKNGKLEGIVRQFLEPGDPFYQQMIGYPSLIVPAALGGGLNAVVDLAVGITIFTIGPDQAIKDLKKLGPLLRDVLKKGIGEYGKDYWEYMKNDTPEAFGDTVFVGSYVTTLLSLGMMIPYVPNVFGLSAGLATSSVSSIKHIPEIFKINNSIMKKNIQVKTVRKTLSKIDKSNTIKQQIISKTKQVENIKKQIVSQKNTSNDSANVQVSHLENQKLTLQKELQVLTQQDEILYIQINEGFKEIQKEILVPRGVEAVKKTILENRQKTLKGNVEKIQALEEKYSKMSKGETPLEHSDFYHNLGLEYALLGELEKSLEALLKSFEIKKREIPDSLDFANLCEHIGRIYNKQGNIGESLKMYQRSFKVLQKQQLESLEIAQLSSEIGYLLRSQGKGDKALDMLHKSLKIHERLNTEYSEIAYILNTIGGIYKKQGKGEEALKVFYRELDLRKQYEAETIAIYYLQHEIGHLNKQEGNIVQALESFLDAARIQEKIFPESPNLADILNEIGFIYKTQGKNIEAQKMFYRVQEMRKGRIDQEGAIRGEINDLKLQRQSLRNKNKKIYKEAREIGNKLGRKGQEIVERTDDVSNMVQKTSNFSRMLYISSLNLENFLTGKYENSEVKEIMNEIGKSARFIISKEFQELGENETLNKDEINKKILEQIIANKEKLRYDIDVGQVRKALNGEVLLKEFEGEEELAKVIDNSSSLFIERLGVLEKTRVAESDVDRLILIFIEDRERPGEPENIDE